MDKLFELRKKMKEEALDAVIIFDELNARYLSEYAFTDGYLCISQDEAQLVTDFRYYEAALAAANSDFKVLSPTSRDETFKKFLADNNVKRIGFEGESVTFGLYKRYQDKYPELEFVSINRMIENLRRVKTTQELGKMQAAQDITDKAFSHLLSVIKPDMTEIEVAAELEYVMRRLGADGPAFDTIAVSGRASSVPHGTPRNVKLEKGFLTVDFGAKLDGYLSDMTRTVVIGKADADIKKLYNTVLTAQEKALEFLRAGVDAGEADKVARDIIDSYPEFKGAFGHSLGHSIGLFIHEAPGLSQKSFGIKLMEGQVTSVEPGIYLFGKYGCRIEDMVAIQKDGILNFTKSTKELIEIY